MSLACAFAPASDPETNELVYNACWGSQARANSGTPRCDVSPLKSVQLEAQTKESNSTGRAISSGLSLRVNSTYYCAVQACNRAGLCSVAFSDGVTIGTFCTSVIPGGSGPVSERFCNCQSPGLMGDRTVLLPAPSPPPLPLIQFREPPTPWS